MPQWLPILSWGSFILGLPMAAGIAIDVTRTDLERQERAQAV